MLWILACWASDFPPGGGAGLRGPTDPRAGPGGRRGSRRDRPAPGRCRPARRCVTTSGSTTAPLAADAGTAPTGRLRCGVSPPRTTHRRTGATPTGHPWNPVRQRCPARTPSTPDTTPDNRTAARRGGGAATQSPPTRTPTRRRPSAAARNTAAAARRHPQRDTGRAVHDPRSGGIPTARHEPKPTPPLRHFPHPDQPGQVCGHGTSGSVASTDRRRTDPAEAGAGRCRVPPSAVHGATICGARPPRATT